MKVSGSAAKNSNSQISNRLQEITSKLAMKDPTLWGTTAAAEASIRLNWIDLPIASRNLLPQLDALSAWARSSKLTEISYVEWVAHHLRQKLLRQLTGRN